MSESYPYVGTFDSRGQTIVFDDGATLIIRRHTFDAEFRATIDKHPGEAVNGHAPVSRVYSVTLDTQGTDMRQRRPVLWTVPIIAGGETPLKVYQNPLYPNPTGWRPTDDEVNDIGGVNALAELEVFDTWEIVDNSPS